MDTEEKKITAEYEKAMEHYKQQKSVLDKIRDSYTIEDFEFDSGYFIFDMGGYAVCTFTLKETPKWKYGIWITEKGYSIFGEHKLLVDKFKPTRCYISGDNNIEEFVKDVAEVIENPKVIFVDSLTYGDAKEPWKEKWLDGKIDFIRGYQCNSEYNPETDMYDKYTRDTSITQEAFVDKEIKEFCTSEECTIDDII